MDRLVRWYLKRSYKAMVINYTANGCIPISRAEYGERFPVEIVRNKRYSPFAT